MVLIYFAFLHKGSSGDNKSRSTGAAIGGAVGGVLFFIFITSVVLLVLLYIKHSKNKKSLNIQSPNKGTIIVVISWVYIRSLYICITLNRKK